MSEGVSFPVTSEWLMQQMEIEWATSATLKHWQYVVAPVPMEHHNRLWEGDERDDGHEGLDPESFARLPQAEAVGLTVAEVVGLRLYTGPGYRVINNACHALMHSFDATIFCITAGIIKLANTDAPAPSQVPFPLCTFQIHPGVTP